MSRGASTTSDRIDAAVSAWIESGEAGQRDLIVEAEVPAAGFSIESPRRLGGVPAAPRVKPLSAPQRKEREERFAALGRVLRELGAEAKALPHADAFVVSLSTEQARELAKSKLVRRMRINPRIARAPSPPRRARR
jgi:hypothetical protein